MSSHWQPRARAPELGTIVCALINDVHLVGTTTVHAPRILKIEYTVFNILRARHTDLFYSGGPPVLSPRRALRGEAQHIVHETMQARQEHIAPAVTCDGHVGGRRRVRVPLPLLRRDAPLPVVPVLAKQNF